MIVFLGDSITQWWDVEYFNHYFGMYKPVNLGMAGHTSRDTRQYLELSHFNNLKPSKVVLQIGTNDGDHHMSTGETVANIQQICKAILEHSPDSKVLLIGPLPRGELPSNRHRIYNREVNKLLRKADRDPKVTYVDISIMFFKEDEVISKNVMHDFLHLTKLGYHILSEIVSEFLFSSTQSHMLASAPAPLPRLS